MDRIAIIGCCGAGKSTLSRKLHASTKLPLFHLDQYFWKPDWTETENPEWSQIVTQLASKDQWIIDGNYGGTMDIRLQRADAVILLYYNTFRCLRRVVSRTWKHYGVVRPDMPSGCNERFDFDFLHYVATYNMTRIPSILRKLESLKKENGLKVFISKNDQETTVIANKISEHLQ